MGLWLNVSIEDIMMEGEGISAGEGMGEEGEGEE